MILWEAPRSRFAFSSSKDSPSVGIAPTSSFVGIAGGPNTRSLMLFHVSYHNPRPIFHCSPNLHLSPHTLLALSYNRHQKLIPICFQDLRPGSACVCHNLPLPPCLTPPPRRSPSCPYPPPPPAGSTPPSGTQRWPPTSGPSTAPSWTPCRPAGDPVGWALGGRRGENTFPGILNYISCSLFLLFFILIDFCPSLHNYSPRDGG